MTTTESMNFTYDMFKHYRESGYDEKASVELAVQDMVKIVTATSKIVEEN